MRSPSDRPTQKRFDSVIVSYCLASPIKNKSHDPIPRPSPPVPPCQWSSPRRMPTSPLRVTLSIEPTPSLLSSAAGVKSDTATDTYTVCTASRSIAVTDLEAHQASLRVKLTRLDLMQSLGVLIICPHQAPTQTCHSQKWQVAHLVNSLVGPDVYSHPIAYDKPATWPVRGAMHL
jgi:hypothetical protein